MRPWSSRDTCKQVACTNSSHACQFLFQSRADRGLLTQINPQHPSRGDTRPVMIRVASERADALRASLLALMEAVAQEEDSQRASIAAALPKHRSSATNLAHYLGLRKQDVHTPAARAGGPRPVLARPLRGTCPRHARSGYRPGSRATATRRWHPTRARTSTGPRPRPSCTRTPARCSARDRATRHVYIMVTAPDAAEVTAGWADDLLQAGADLLRINGAHESPQEWAAIASTFKARAAARGKPGRVVVDLPGPKLRTEIRQLEEGVLHLPRRKDRLGRTVAPTPVLLVAEHTAGAQIPVPPEWLAGLQAGDVITLTDPDGTGARALGARSAAEGGVAAECRPLAVRHARPAARLAARRDAAGSGRSGNAAQRSRGRSS